LQLCIAVFLNFGYTFELLVKIKNMQARNADAHLWRWKQEALVRVLGNSARSYLKNKRTGGVA
jgi:TPP-dependent 2-oxoacid decarboxylase